LVEKAGMLTSKWFIGFLGLCVLGVLTFYFGKPAYLKLKDFRATQLAESAFHTYLQDPSDAEVIRVAYEKAQSALLLSSANYAANRTVATLVLFSNPALSLSYWEKSLAIRNGKDFESSIDQMHYIQALILNGQIAKARTKLEATHGDDAFEADIEYNLVKVCYLLGDKKAALDYGRKMIKNRYTPLQRHLLFANICLNSEDEAVRNEGEKHVRFLLLNEDLMDDSVLWQMSQFANLSQSLRDQLDQALNKRISDYEERIKLVDYRISNHLITLDEGLDTLRKNLNTSDSLSVIRLSEWCSEHHFYKEVVDLMNVDLALKRKDWFLLYLKNLGLNQNWDKIIKILTTEDCPIETFLSDILKSEAFSESGDKIKAINSWYRAKLSSNPVTSDLWLLIRIGDKMGLENDTEKMLRELVIVGEDPERVLSYVAAREIAKKDYGNFYRILSGFRELYNNVGSIVNDWAYYAILMDKDYDGAMAEINRLIEADPNVLRYHMTWALGMIKQNQYREVLARFQQFKLDWMTLHPKWRYILALALAGVGEYEQGETYLENVDVQSLNPYELDLYEKLFYYRKTSPRG